MVWTVPSELMRRTVKSPVSAIRRRPDGSNERKLGPNNEAFAAGVPFGVLSNCPLPATVLIVPVAETIPDAEVSDVLDEEISIPADRNAFGKSEGGH